MKTSAAISFLLATGLASAHYTFNRLILKGVETKAWEYVRENTRAEQYMPTKFIKSFGVTPLDNDFRCNMGSFSNAGKTKVADVAPGEELAVKLGVGATMRHPGPAQVYLSKAPGSVIQYEGDGDWFKIHDETVCGSTADGLQDTDWCTWDKDRVAFTIPLGTPPGEYLVRVEHVGLHGAHVGEAEFYYSCAQVKISGNGSGSPQPLVKFPGAYSPQDPGIAFSIWNKPQSYPYHIGPEVWVGGVGGAAGNTTEDVIKDGKTSTIANLPSSTLVTSTKRPTNPVVPTSAAVSTSTVVSAVPTVTSTSPAVVTSVTSNEPAAPSFPYGGPRGHRTFKCIEVEE